MLQMRLLSILILVYSDLSSLQDSVPDEDAKYEVQKEFEDSNTLNSERLGKEYLGNQLEYYITHNKAKNDSGLPNERKNFVGEHYYSSNIDSKGPKIIKLTYKKRFRTSNKKKSHVSNTNNEDLYIPEKKLEHKDSNDSLISDNTELLPLLLEYLNGYEAKKLNLGDDFTLKNDSIDKTKRVQNNIENKNEELSKFDRRAWNKMVFYVNKDPDVKQGHKNNVIEMIDFPNTELHSEHEKVSHKDDLISEHGIKKEQGADNGFIRKYTQEGGNNVITHLRNGNNLDADNKEKKVAHTAENIEFLVDEMCANSKTNLLEFWKLTANYFGLHDKNLSNKQKFDLFLAILKKVNDKKQQDAVEIVPSKPKTDDYLSKELISKEVLPTEDLKVITWSDSLKPEKTQDQGPNPNKELLFLSQNQKVAGGLVTDETFLLNKNNPDEALNNIQISLNQPKDVVGDKNFSNEEPSLYTLRFGETNPNQLPKPFEIPQAFGTDSYFNNKPVNSSETVNLYFTKLDETTPKSDLDKETKQKETFRKDYLLSENSKYLKKDTEQSKLNNITFVVTPRTVNVDSRLKIEEGNPLLEEGLPDLSISKPEGRENIYVEQDLNNKSLLDYLNIVKSKKAKPADNVVTKESSESEEKSLDPVEINQVIKALSNEENSAQESVLLGLEGDDEMANNFKKTNSKTLAILIQYLNTLPKDELHKLSLYLKAKKVLHPKLALQYYTAKKNSYEPENLNEFGSLVNSESDEKDSDKLKLFLHSKGQPKDKEEKTSLDLNASQNLHPKLLLKYNLSFKNKVADVNQFKDVAVRSLVDSTLKPDVPDPDEKTVRPKFKFKWNFKQRITYNNYLTKVLLEIIDRFGEYGISDVALQEIIGYLQRTLSENDGDSECQAKEVNKKLNEIKEGFENLLTLKTQAEERREV